MRSGTALALAAALCLARAAVGQEPAGEGESKPPEKDLGKYFADEGVLFAEEPIVVSAAKVEQKRKEAPSAVWVITSEEILRSAATSVPDLLRSVPGIEVFFTSVSDPNVGARGLNSLLSNGVLVLVDGRHVYLDNLGRVPWNALPMGLQDIDRIEVIRGPGSALFGANAFHAVINIFTKRPDKWTGTRIAAMGAEHDTATTDLLHAGRYGEIGYRLSLGWKTADHPGAFARQREDAVDAKRGNLLVEYYPAENTTLGLGLGTVRVDDEILSDGGPIFSHGSLPHIMLEFHHKRDDSEWHARAYWNALQDFEIESLNLPTSDLTIHNRYSSGDGEMQHTRRLGDRHRATAGFTYRVNDIDLQVLRKKLTHRIAGIFLQDEWKLAEPLTLTVGARYDVHSEFRENLSPRASLVWELAEDHVLRFSWSKAFRNPSAVEAFILNRNRRELALPSPPFPTAQAPFTLDTVGDDRLSPETMTSYEVAWLGRPVDWLKLEVAAYHNRVRDIIELNRNDPALGPVWEAEDFVGIVAPGAEQATADTYNFSPAPPIQGLRNSLAASGVSTGGTAVRGKSDPRVYGFEVAAEALAADWLSFFGNYSFTDVYDEHFRTNLRLAPVSKFNIGARATLPGGVSATVVNHYVGKIDTRFGKAGSYNLVDVRIGYRFGMGKATGEVALSAENVLGHEHREFPTGDTLDRRAMLTLGIEF